MTLLKIGLTGGIASGKTHVSQLFANKNITIIDADEIARNLFNSKSPLLEKLKEKFGSSIFTQDGTLDRKALGKIVFNSAESLAWLNRLTHPEITKEIKIQILNVKSPYVILDIPLLIDKTGKIPSHLQKLVDRILVIDVNLQQQIHRLCKRDNILAQDAKSIINTQSSLSQKLALADDIIDNNGDISRLEPQIEALHEKYLRMSCKEIQ